MTIMGRLFEVEGEEHHRMRRPCNCGSWVARVERRATQQCLFCLECSLYQYNAPKSELPPPPPKSEIAPP